MTECHFFAFELTQVLVIYAWGSYVEINMLCFPLSQIIIIFFIHKWQDQYYEFCYCLSFLFLGHKFYWHWFSWSERMWLLTFLGHVVGSISISFLRCYLDWWNILKLSKRETEFSSFSWSAQYERGSCMLFLSCNIFPFEEITSCALLVSCTYLVLFFVCLKES